jgi:hypothetical protein
MSITSLLNKIKGAQADIEKTNNSLLEGMVQFSKELQEGLKEMNFEVYAIKTVNVKKEIGVVLLADDSENEGESQKKKCQQVRKILLHDSVSTDDTIIYQTTNKAVEDLVRSKLDNLCSIFSIEEDVVEAVRQQGYQVVSQVMKQFDAAKDTHTKLKLSIVDVLQDDNLDLSTKLDKITNLVI